MSENVSAVMGSRTSAESSTAKAFEFLPPFITGLRWLLFLIAAWQFSWPVYRAFLNIEIETNEGWNAYFSDAALGRMPLYPSADKLITNNYPPLSFYIVGGLGRLVGDPILAGRLLSLAAVFVIGGTVTGAVRALGGDRAGAGVGGAVFVATISRFSSSYVGMNEPQLLAHALMSIGFAWFLRSNARNESCLWPILFMAFAGFVKHNIISMPLAALLWLGFHRPREALKCALVSGAAVAAGFALCFALYGHDFFLNMLSSRQYSWARSWGAAGELKPLSAALAAIALLGWFRWKDRNVRLCALLVSIAVGTFFLQRTGAGVDKNSIFDLLIAASIGTGIAFSHAGSAFNTQPGASADDIPPRPKRIPIAFVLQAAFLLVLALRLSYFQEFTSSYPFRMFFDPSFKTEIATRERAMADSIAKVRAVPGAVMTTNYVCYRAGKPFTIDKFNAEQRVLTGALPSDAITSLIESRRISVVHPDRRGDWYNPLVKKKSE